MTRRTRVLQFITSFILLGITEILQVIWKSHFSLVTSPIPRHTGHSGSRCMYGSFHHACCKGFWVYSRGLSQPYPLVVVRLRWRLARLKTTISWNMWLYNYSSEPIGSQNQRCNGLRVVDYHNDRENNIDGKNAKPVRTVRFARRILASCRRLNRSMIPPLALDHPS